MSNLSRSSWVLAAVWCALAGLSCSSDSGPSGEAKSGGSRPAAAGAKEEVKIQGAGASFPAPLYMKWFKTYSSAHPGVQIDYQSVGSGKGVQQVIEKIVDFGASDAAMTAEEMAKVDVGVQLLPMTAGSIVLAYNLERVDHLKLTREAYVGIFLGKVTKWNDAKIAAANPGVSLPDGGVNVVVRSDGSGTSYVFTKHLSALSDEFAKQVGTNKQPNWPVGTKANKNDGVAASLIQTPGSIGYIEYGYAKLNPSKLKMAELQNKAGKFVAPAIESGQAALAAITLPEDLIAWMPDPDGEKSYPIVTFTWIIAYKKYPDAQKAQTLKDALGYCLTDGQKAAEPLGYIPLPAGTVSKVKAALDNIK
jgi:phosphate transport system substrate-binding protein